MAAKKVRSIRSEGCEEQQSLALQRSALGSATLSADVAAARGGRRHHLRFSGSQFRGTEQAAAASDSGAPACRPVPL